MSLPVFPVQTREGVQLGALAAPAAGNAKAPRLSLSELPNAPQHEQSKPR